MCTHHWMIEPADGETSRGVCKLCGDTREFANNIGLIAKNKFIPDSLKTGKIKKPRKKKEG